MVLVKDPPIPPLEPPPPPKAPPAEPITEEPPPEVVDAPGPWLAIGAIASLAGVIISHYGFKSIVNTLFVKPTGFLGRLFRHVFPSPQEMVQAISRAVTHDLAQYFALSSPGVARWLTKEAKVVNALTGEIMANAEATYDALVRLRVITIPTLIREAVRPLVKAINGLDSRLTTVENKVADATAYINTELRRLPWGQGATFPLAMRQFMGAFNQLWTQFFDYTRPKLDLFFNVTLPALNRKVNEMFTDLYTTGKDGLDGIRSRLLNVRSEEHTSELQSPK